MLLPLKPFSFSHLQPPRVLQHVTAVVSETCLKHLQVIRRFTLPSLTFLLIVGIE